MGGAVTAVPVVSATLTTRTYKEFGADFPHDTERLTVDPVFVVLPEAPDLTCRECKGKGRKPGTPISGFRPQLHCSSCRGFGISPVYGCTRQCRWDFGGYVPPEGHWAAGTTEWAYRPQCSVDPGPSSYQGAIHERRQVVEWRARRVEPLPVVDDLPPFEGNRGWECVTVKGPWPLHRVWPGFGSAKGGWVDGLSNAPWAVDLRPGQFVLRLDGWEHLEQPHTEMPCGCDNGNVTHDDGSVDQCARCSSVCSVPLSVPDGVLSWIELA